MLPTILLHLLSLLLFRTADGQISVTDDLQRNVAISAPVRRIVSLAPSVTETLFAVGAGEQVIGVTDYCNYPPEASTKTSVGGVIHPSIEAIIGLNPDLIVLSMEGNVREDFGHLTGLNIPVFVTNPRTVDGIYKSITDLGTLTGRDREAASLVQSLQGKAQAARGRLPTERKRTMFIVSLQPLIVVGAGTFLAELLELAGADNIAAHSSSTYPTYSREAVVVQNPQVILMMADLIDDPRELLKIFPEWKNLAATQTGNIHRIDSDIVSRPGPRALTALEMLSGIIRRR